MKLSGGEQQMLCIGRALMTNPELLLMDEPSEGLAPLVIRELASVIKQLNSSGLSVLLVEQNFYLALTTASYIYILSKGTVAFHGTPQEIRSNEEVQTRYLGAAI